MGTVAMVDAAAIEANFEMMTHLAEGGSRLPLISTGLGRLVA